MSQSVPPEKVMISAEGLKTLDESMQAYVDQGKVAGMATLIARNGQIVHQGCYGKLDLATGSPVDPHSLFRLYSLTKPITAVATLMLHERGYFDLHDPVTKWIPEFKDLNVLRRGANTTPEYVDLERELTFWHLLTHTAGFGYGFEPGDPLADLYGEAGFFSPLMTLQVSLPELIRKLIDLPLANQPGEVFRYSLSYDILAYLIELISGIPFDMYLREQILQPLGMGETAFFIPADQHHRLGTLYGYPGPGGILLLEEAAKSPLAKPDSVRSGGGGLVSSSLDYFRFLSMLLNGGELGGIHCLKPETIQKIISSQVEIPFREGMAYGLGVGVQTRDARPDGLPRGAFGWDSAGGAEAWTDPQTGLTAIIMYQAFAYPEPARRFRSLAFGSLLV